MRILAYNIRGFGTVLNQTELIIDFVKITQNLHYASLHEK